jgi:hypothetical protein
MAETKPKTFFENCVSTIITGSKFFLDDLPPRIRPFAKVPVFLFFFLLFLAVAPIAILSKLVRKPAVNPFFKLRTELETKWYSGKQYEALSELREVKKALFENQMQIYFRGVQIPQYGKFKFNEFINTMWLLYHWEFNLGNFQEASEVCDYFIDTLKPKPTKIKGQRGYWEEWVLNKAKAIYKKNGNTAAQEYLLKFVDTKNENSRINNYLYEIRDESKKIV